MRKIKSLSLTFWLLVMLLATGCSSTKNSEAMIATSVALTVQAQTTPSASVTPPPSPSELPPTEVTPAPATPPAETATTAPASAGDPACMKASLVGETIPDGTIFRPGEQFTKIWYIKNSSTCIWTTDYKIVFWDGDVLGGAYEYSLPQQVLPGETVAIPLVLVAPAADGTYTSEWKMATPGGARFGVGNDSPFWVKIVVSSAKNIEYGITSVKYSVVREPASGCPANVFFTIYAEITTNGPLEITYTFVKSDGTTESKQTLNFPKATTKTVSVTWSLHRGASTNERWVQLVILSPFQQEFEKARFTYTCQ
jgi:hypothetical protein